MVGEIAARLSGGYMSGWTFPLASGVEVTEAALNIAVGLPPGDLAPRLRKVCAERALISIPGIVERGRGRRRGAEAEAESKRSFLRVAPGDTVVFPSNNVQKCGNVLAVADSPRQGRSLRQPRPRQSFRSGFARSSQRTTAHLFADRRT